LKKDKNRKPIWANVGAILSAASATVDGYEGLFNQKRPKFEINDINKRILTSFEKKRWISSFDIDKDDTNYYRAYGRRTHIEKPEFLD